MCQEQDRGGPKVPATVTFLFYLFFPSKQSTVIVIRQAANATASPAPKHIGGGLPATSRAFC